MHLYRDLLLSISCLSVAPLVGIAQTYERVDVDSLEQPANAPIVGGADISQDGRFVAFLSYATNFDALEVNFTPDLFLRDRVLGTTSRITISPIMSVEFQLPCISGDGSKVAFMRRASPGQYQAFVHVVAAGTYSEIIVPGLPDLRIDAFSYDGRFVVLEAFASSPAPKVYRLDLTNGDVVSCSRALSGNPVEGYSPDIDDDGTHVTFLSSSSIILPGDTNGVPDVFVLDIPGNLMVRASLGQIGTQPLQQCRFPSISGDGRYVVFDTHSTLIFPDNNSSGDVFIRDLRLGTIAYVSLTTSQSQFPFGALWRALISGDGSSVALSTTHPIVPGDGQNSPDAFVRDIEPGVLLPASPGAPGFQASSPMAVTRDGREVLLFTEQPALGAQPTHPQLYVAKFGPRCSSSGYCTSLPNSTGQPASIGAQGDASRQLNTLVISAVGLPDTANALLVSGTSAVDPGTPFGNGLLCIGGALIRHGIHVAIGGVILDAQDVNSAEYLGVLPGDTRYYQVVYRDPPAGGALFNTTDAVAVTFCW